MATAGHAKQATDFRDFFITLLTAVICLFLRAQGQGGGRRMMDDVDGLATGWKLMYYWSIPSLRETVIGF